MKIKTKKIILFLILFIILFTTISLLFFFLTLPDVSNLKKANPKLSALMKQRISEAKKHKGKYKIYKRWIKLKKIPKLLKQAVIITEDSNFYYHNGIDYHELKESIKKNISSGKKLRGGSTITQQLAKNLFLSTEKSYFRKIREFFIAKRLEKHLSKNRILEIYLNVIEFGRGVFGVEAASQYFFKKSVNKLNLSEIIRIVSVIPKPLKVTPLSKSKYLKWRFNYILMRLKQRKIIDLKTYKKLKKII